MQTGPVLIIQLGKNLVGGVTVRNLDINLKLIIIST